MNVRAILGLSLISYHLLAASSVAQGVYTSPAWSGYAYPAAYVYASGYGPNDVRLEFGGPQYNVMEARLGDNVYRETLQDFTWFPWYGVFYAAPQQGAGAFALLDGRKPGTFLVMAWKESTDVAIPRRAIAVSPDSDQTNLPFRVAGPEPVRLQWLSATTLRIAQRDPSLSGEDKDLVRVIRFDPKAGEWYLIWPAPDPSGLGVIVKKR